ncbi:MAG: 30S ribosomal protein S8 [Candidatus Taylorbacteria bacterium RIFCSPLOWO2_01_FULL_45_15b]|uniref:Small ribosomal subunit protein uS8 n=1 Tax=Candidatus Taylorbacteria bacterium RIFCSPLOWO2_01_FULL_45_15b TaxID=1802319 RepID=A0A1G2NAB1_9BACT|nr:MAG: 30S ribosomal protein S8 [Candidatus Taylorbacteria bacterium RIFCSPLOWO2_01_FULL_45_15b]
MDHISHLISTMTTIAGAGKRDFEVASNKLIRAILLTLEKEGYLKVVEDKNSKDPKTLRAVLSSDASGKAKIHGAERVSKFSKRIYSASASLGGRRARSGSLVVSTSRGVMTGREAAAARVGGEILFEIW